MNDYSYALFATPRNERTIKDLSAADANFIVIPAYLDVPSELQPIEKTSIEKTLEFDWIFFEDVFSVDHYINLLSAIGFDLFELDAVRICAVGKAVADRLRMSEIHSDIISDAVDSSEILAEFCRYVGESKIDLVKVLVVGQVDSSFEIINKLKTLINEVIEVGIYRLIEPDSQQIGKIKALISGGAIDEFIFSDAIDLVFLNRLTPNENWHQVFAETTVSAIGSELLPILSDYGFSPRPFSRERIS